VSSLRTILHRHRALRWLAPVGVLGAVAVAAGGMAVSAPEPGPLPATSPGTLLADMSTPTVTGFSGTIVAKMSLGLPSLPGLTTTSSDTSLSSLLSGSHTLRFWYGGPDKQRVALLGATDELDVFHSGTTIWQWDSSSHVATRLTLPVEAHTTLPTSPATLTPDQLARRALAAIGPSTAVAMGANRTVAHRSAYVLTLTPRDHSSRVGSVHITVDGQTKVPLGVQVYARGDATAAIDVAFTDVTFRAPSGANFAFTPPPGALQRVERPTGPGVRGTARTGEHAVIGSGWTSVLEYRTTPAQLAHLGGGALKALPRVTGPWGSGRLADSTLVAALVTDDGRVFAGAVEPDVLYSAAATHK
jgi:hypothetical protein